eukprot:1055494-Amphidinium_carterae.1
MLSTVSASCRNDAKCISSIGFKSQSIPPTLLCVKFTFVAFLATRVAFQIPHLKALTCVLQGSCDWKLCVALSTTYTRASTPAVEQLECGEQLWVQRTFLRPIGQKELT